MDVLPEKENFFLGFPMAEYPTIDIYWGRWGSGGTALCFLNLNSRWSKVARLMLWCEKWFLTLRENKLQAFGKKVLRKISAVRSMK
jgi:hypothetical protein